MSAALLPDYRPIPRLQWRLWRRVIGVPAWAWMIIAFVGLVAMSQLAGPSSAAAVVTRSAACSMVPTEDGGQTVISFDDGIAYLNKHLNKVVSSGVNWSQVSFEIKEVTTVHAVWRGLQVSHPPSYDRQIVASWRPGPWSVPTLADGRVEAMIDSWIAESGRVAVFGMPGFDSSDLLGKPRLRPSAGDAEYGRTLWSTPVERVWSARNLAVTVLTMLAYPVCLIAAVSALLLVVPCPAERRVGRWVEGRCPECGYPRGTSGPCSECGAEAQEPNELARLKKG